MIMEWTCHICGETRPDALISVFTTDTSKKYGLPPDTMKQNVRFCKDKKSCIEGAKTFSFTKKEEK